MKILTKLLVLRPEAEPTVEEVLYDKTTTFDEMLKPWLGGGHTEHVSIWVQLEPKWGVMPRPALHYPTPGAMKKDNVVRRDMFVDELGRLKGLPINARATRLYNPGYMGMGLDNDFIVGPAVVFVDKLVWR